MSLSLIITDYRLSRGSRRGRLRLHPPSAPAFGMGGGGFGWVLFYRLMIVTLGRSGLARGHHITGPSGEARWRCDCGDGGWQTQKGEGVGRRRTDIFIRKLVGEADSLRLVLDRLSVDDGALELLDDGPMDGVALLLGCWSAYVSGVNTEKGGASLQSLRQCTCWRGGQRATSSLASCPWAWCRLGRGSASPTYNVG